MQTTSSSAKPSSARSRFRAATESPSPSGLNTSSSIPSGRTSTFSGGIPWNRTAMSAASELMA
jgi:hypothetical protein